MRRPLLIAALISITHSSFSQKAELVNFEKERTAISKKSMLVLGGWSVANIVVSGIATKTQKH